MVLLSQSVLALAASPWLSDRDSRLGVQAETAVLGTDRVLKNGHLARIGYGLIQVDQAMIWLDSDADGVLNDNCPALANVDQLNNDNDAHRRCLRS